LVDALGSFTVALEKARELGGLPKDKRPAAMILTPPRKSTLPPAFATADPAKIALDAVSEFRALLLTTRMWAISLWQEPRL
jgi:hypothetical protein